MLSGLVYYLALIVVLLLVSAYFSAAETAMTAVTRTRLYQLTVGGDKAAGIVSSLRRDKERMIGTILLGYNVTTISACVIATSLSLIYFGNGHGLVLTTLGMTLLVVICTQLLPKIYTIHHAEKVALKLAPSLQFCVRLFSPLTRCLHLVVRIVFSCCGVQVGKDDASFVSAADIIRGIVEMQHNEGHMVKQDRDMIGSILDMRDTHVSKVMTHRMQVETLDADLPPDVLVKEAVRTLHSRIPLWQGEPDNIIGLLHVKNLVKMLTERDAITGGVVSSKAILGLCVKPWFIPDTTSLRDQLVAFRNVRQHFAFVVDEYGAWKGVVTLEDIIEQIVGEIDDEHDEVESDIQRAGAHTFYVSGALPVRELNRHLDWELPEEHAATVAGLVIHVGEKLPMVGERFDMEGFRFTVVSKDGMQITRVRIDMLAGTAPGAAHG